MSDINSLLVTHKWAEVNDIEDLCKPDAVELLERLSREEGVEEAFVLQTCNRAEFYVSGTNGTRALEEFADDLDISSRLVRYHGHSESIRHIMRVTCGLESMVLGEDEILGQVQDAYHTAHDNGYIDSTLEKTLMKAIHLGERVRTETSINEGNASLASAAVELARRHLGELSGIKVLVIGVGEMGKMVSKSLIDRGNEYDAILVANRTYERAANLAGEIGGRPVKFAELSRHLRDVDVVISATAAPHLIFDRSDLKGHNLLVLDMANPRDIDEGAKDLEGIDLIDIDDLSEVSNTSLENRREAAETVERMINEEIEELERQFKEEKAMEMLSRIYSRAEDLRQDETQKAIRRIQENGDDLSEYEKEVMNDLTKSLVNKLLSDPTRALKQAAISEDYETIQSASQIFSLSESASHSPEAESTED